MSHSIYIPKISISITEKALRNILRPYGYINSIDYAVHNNIPGFKAFSEAENEIECEYFTSAFVYFDIIFRGENIKLWDLIDIGYSCIIPYVTGGLLCLPNKNPLKRTRMNTHQIFENCIYLEGQIETIKEENKNDVSCLKHDIQLLCQENFDLKSRLNNCEQIIHQLVGGLFNDKTQAGIMSVYTKVLLPETTTHLKIPENKSKYGISPTTRQGDKLEKRIRVLEEIICKKYMDEEDTNSDHSSMPELIYEGDEEEDEEEDGEDDGEEDGEEDDGEEDDGEEDGEDEEEEN